MLDIMGEDGGNRNDDNEDDKTRPFEWLTSPASLEPFLLKALQEDEDEAGNGAFGGGRPGGRATGRRNKTILHVGCGRSALGEYLALSPTFGAALVVNADSDVDALEAVHRRWTQTRSVEDGIAEAEMLFQAVEVGSQRLAFPDGHFDCVVDKGTLDCVLCHHGGGTQHEPGGGGGGGVPSSSSVADFLWEVHRLLCADGGAYLVVSFHSVDFVRPLLLAPGLDWDVEAFVLERQTESLPLAHRPASATVPLTPTVVADDHVLHSRGASPDAQARDPAQSEEPTPRSPWSSNGTFEPDLSYQRNVSVLICRRRKPPNAVEVPPDPSKIVTHVNEVMDEWFRVQNPMLTPTREEFIRRQMPTALPLQRGYEILFTDAERAHYTYDLFREDWDAYCEEQFGNSSSPIRQEMSCDVAIHFLRETQ